MKHLIIYNHLGEKEHDYAVFVEGMDFQKSFDIPTCIWLGKIILVDKEPEPEIQEEWIAQQEAVAEKEMREIAIAKEEMKEITEVLDEIQEMEEVISEPETVSDTSRRDEGISPAEQPESLEVAPESDTTRDVTLGSEVDRQPTTSENTLGGRSKQRSPRGRRGKAKRTNIEEV